MTLLFWSGISATWHFSSHGGIFSLNKSKIRCLYLMKMTSSHCCYNNNEMNSGTTLCLEWAACRSWCQSPRGVNQESLGEDDRLRGLYLSIISSHSALDFTDATGQRKLPCWLNLSSKPFTVVRDILTLIFWSWPELLFIKPLRDESADLQLQSNKLYCAAWKGFLAHIILQEICVDFWGYFIFLSPFIHLWL